MEKIIIEGQRPLSGSLEISGAKNAALPLLAGALLCKDQFILENVPDLADVHTLMALLQGHGTHIEITDGDNMSKTLTMSTPEITSTVAPYDLVRTMRASVLVLGPLLARTGQAKVSLPGGCAIGARPVDLHLKALEAMGAVITIQDGYIVAEAKNGLQGAEYEFPFVSVGATENIIMAATLAQGKTTLQRVAKEPEIIDLAKCLNAMGAKITGAGTDVIEIQGVAQLTPARHRVLADRIEAGSFACIGAMNDKPITLNGITADILEYPLEILKRAGATVTVGDNSITVVGGNIHGVDITTAPYPEFPTDLQAQFMAMFAMAKGSSIVNETIFENRFMHVPELSRLGADIDLEPHKATVRGVDALRGAEVMATDLRASISLVIAGLFASGKTEISRIYHLDRGYSHLEEKLVGIGADIKRIKA